MHSFDTIIVDVAPQIRQILRTEQMGKRAKAQQMSPNGIWSNKRITRGQMKEENEGKKRYFDTRLDAEGVLKTWLEIPGAESTDHKGDMHDEA